MSAIYALSAGYLRRPTIDTKFVPPISGLPSSVEAQTSATRTSTSVVFTPDPRRCTLTVALYMYMLHDVDHREIFGCTRLKFTVSGWSKQASKQASIDTHTCTQCSHASVGLAQARPNYNCSI